MSTYVNDPGAGVKLLANRYKLLYIGVLVVFGILTSRLWYLQIMSGQELRLFSEQNLLKEVNIYAPRGFILDREGKVLVENLPSFEATISPQYTEDLDATAKAVAQVLGLKATQIVDSVKTSRRNNGPFRPVVVKSNLSRDEVFKLELLKLDHSGLDVREYVLRSYPMGPNGAQLLGYVGEISKEQLKKLNETSPVPFKQGDILGRSGIELTYDRYLRGQDGLRFIKVDARGREANTEDNFLGSLSRVQPATQGSDVHLTIDKDVQEAAYQAFIEHDRTGALVAVGRQGEVLAWVSYPSFDPNDFASGISAALWSKLVNDPDKPLRNKVIQDHNSPGSTFKPFVALAALQEGEINRDTRILAPGSLRFGNRTYHDHTRTGQGMVNVREAIERSSNVFFYKMGIALGVDRMAKYAEALGIGKKTGIDLENEVSGLMPTSQWKKSEKGEEWQPGENLSVAIGQGYVLTTPIQMALAYMAIGRNGEIYEPYLVSKVVSPQGQVLYSREPKLKRNLSDPADPVSIRMENFKAVQEGLWSVTNGERGTARWWKIPGVEIAGKTGTSQVISFSADAIYDKCNERPRHLRHHGWFVGYAPAKDPEIAVAVLAEHACAGSSGGAPLVRDVIRAYMYKKYPNLNPANKTPVQAKNALEGSGT